MAQARDRWVTAAVPGQTWRAAALIMADDKPGTTSTSFPVEFLVSAYQRPATAALDVLVRRLSTTETMSLT